MRGFVKISEVIGKQIQPISLLPATDVIDAVHAHALTATREMHYYAENDDDNASYYIDDKGYIIWEPHTAEGTIYT